MALVRKKEVKKEPKEPLFVNIDTTEVSKKETKDGKEKGK